MDLQDIQNNLADSFDPTTQKIPTFLHLPQSYDICSLLKL
jgi:hypothetical protein